MVDVILRPIENILDGFENWKKKVIFFPMVYPSELENSNMEKITGFFWCRFAHGKMLSTIEQRAKEQ